VTLYASAALLAELRGVLEREKFAGHLQVRGLNATQISDGYAALTRVVVPALIAPTVIDDPDDDDVLACALAANADLVVSGDPPAPLVGTSRHTIDGYGKIRHAVGSWHYVEPDRGDMWRSGGPCPPVGLASISREEGRTESSGYRLVVPH
jgi:hypothetical protein